MPHLYRDQFDLEDHGPSKVPMQDHPRDWDWNHGPPILYSVILRILDWACGKPWNESHSYLSKKFERRTEVGRFFWNYVDREVDTKAYVEDGKIWSGWFRYYVHPQTGNLVSAGPNSHIYYPRGWKPPYHEEGEPSVKLDDLNTLQRRNGIWYLEASKMVNEPITKLELVLERIPLRPVSKLVVVGWKQVAEPQRPKQLSHKELRFYKLVNIPIMSTPSRREMARRNTTH